jgi:hypothetical protein
VRASHRNADQTEARHGERHDSAGLEGDTQASVHAIGSVAGERGAHVRAGGDGHAHVAGGGGQEGADNEADGGLPVDGDDERDEDDENGRGENLSAPAREQTGEFARRVTTPLEREGPGAAGTHLVLSHEERLRALLDGHGDGDGLLLGLVQRDGEGLRRGASGHPVSTAMSAAGQAVPHLPREEGSDDERHETAQPGEQHSAARAEVVEAPVDVKVLQRHRDHGCGRRPFCCVRTASAQTDKATPKGPYADCLGVTAGRRMDTLDIGIRLFRVSVQGRNLLGVSAPVTVEYSLKDLSSTYDWISCVRVSASSTPTSARPRASSVQLGGSLDVDPHVLQVMVQTCRLLK